MAAIQALDIVGDAFMEPASRNMGYVSTLERDGFLCVPTFASAEDVQSIDATLRRLLRDGTGFKEGARRDLVDPNDSLGSDSLTELVQPHNYAPELHETRYFAELLELARDILGPEAEFAFDHAILKPAFHGAETPWHQDEAYQSAAHQGRRQIAVWMATSAVTVENGCMRYVTGSHHGEVLTHQPYGGDQRVHGLECIDPFNQEDVAYCPVAAGGIVIHCGRTLHGAGPNKTGNARLAYIVVFSAPALADHVPREFPWLQRPAEAALQRRRQWLLRGGVLIEFARRVRRSRLRGRGGFARRVQQALVRRIRAKLGFRATSGEAASSPKHEHIERVLD